MDRFEVELDKLAEVGYRDLPTAADFVDRAGYHITRCNGLGNRRIFNSVDDAFADLRDMALRTSFVRMQQSLHQMATALQLVHQRYGGADESASTAILQADREQRDLVEDQINEHRKRQEEPDGITAEEIVENVYGSD